MNNSKISIQLISILLVSVCCARHVYAQSYIPKDHHFEEQWYLNNTVNEGIDINVLEAWQITRGEGVKLAIYDDGISNNHEDLNVENIFNTVGENGFSSHGTKCAGIASAIHNNFGIAGVAPESSLISISFSGHFINVIDDGNLDNMVSGFNWATENTDIISCSWRTIENDDISDAINRALTQGRRGLGTVVVFSSANRSLNSQYPTNTIPEILCVGAIDREGYRYSSSGYGSHLDVVACGEKILTTAGNVDYVNFDATSAAAPQVAGVAALVLSVNPNLTARQVNDIIKITASKIEGDGYDYQNKPINENINGLWNEEVGYGLVNAYEAVKLAQSPQYQYICETDIPIPINNDNNNNIINSLDVRYVSSQLINTQFDDVNNNPDVLIKANERVFMLSEYVTLNKGFKVESGGCLDVLIKPCD